MTFFHSLLAVWTLEDLITSVGSINRSAALKALATWVDHGVLKEDPENMFRLLEKAEEGDGDAGRGLIRDARMLGLCSLYCSLLAPFFLIRGGKLMVICYLASAVPENPAISIVQQQQAEQMRVYWKVSISFFFFC